MASASPPVSDTEADKDIVVLDSESTEREIIVRLALVRTVG